MATRKKKTPESGSVVKGTHLTVTTFPDGTTKLEWDDEQLLTEVREAIASVEQTAPPKKTTRKKKATAQ
jgi:YD repeat-containing protein